MDAEISKKEYSIIALLIIIFAGLDVLLYLFINNNDKVINKIEKNKYNTYKSTYITVDKQASIYLNNYYNLIRIDSKKAFEKFEKKSLSHLTTQEAFDDYVKKMNLSSTVVKKLYFHKVGKNAYYSIIDGNDNKVTFKVNGVMNYTVDFR